MTGIDNTLFEEGHYLGKPADFDAKFLQWRTALVKGTEGFCGKDLDLVDIGCGNGAAIFLLSDAFKSCTGIDINNKHEKAFEAERQRRGIDNCSFKVVDIEQELPEEKYDRLTSFEVIEHLRSEDNVNRYAHLLKEGGEAIFTVPHKWWVFETHGASLPLLPWNRVPFFSWLPRPIHERYANARIYTKRRIKKVLEEAGFEVQRMIYITAPLDVLKDSGIKNFFTKYVFKGPTTKNPFMATNIFVHARKRS